MVRFRVRAWVIIMSMKDRNVRVCAHTRTHVCLQTDETTLFSSLAPPVALTTCSGSGGHMTHSLTLYRALWRCPTAKRPRGPHRLLCEHHEDMWPSWRPIIPYGRQTPRTTAPQSSCELQWRINEWEDERACAGGEADKVVRKQQIYRITVRDFWESSLLDI